MYCTDTVNIQLCVVDFGNSDKKGQKEGEEGNKGRSVLLGIFPTDIKKEQWKESDPQKNLTPVMP